MKLTTEEKRILFAIFQNGSSFGDTLSDVRLMLNESVSIQKIASLAKKVDGHKFKIGTLIYHPSSTCSFSKACPGIKNPRNGIAGYSPAEISVKRNRKSN